ncbi:MAG: PsiF family protein [Gammaproteobacteria bacterium]|nr:PsiF family protein [Gammaproteobacteria bacterium]MDH5537144.1 PsiF family protein [Betaproteobacteria bacterium]
MKRLIAAMCLVFATSPLALAQEKAKDVEKKAAPAAAKSAKDKKEPTEKQKAQQARMKDCNAKATDKKGDERQKFMSSCLKGETVDATDKQKAQQAKMKSCNKQAGDKALKGDERKQFMSTCLKG